MTTAHHETRPTGRAGAGTVSAAVYMARAAPSGDAVPVQVISLEGEFDLSNVRQLEQAIDRGIDAGARHFAVDLSAVDFLDGTSVHALIDGWKHAARRNGRFVLVDPPARIWRVLVLIGVSKTFATFASREEALVSFAAGPAHGAGNSQRRSE
jgi:stage II sporulation protein AA (anti-sigma F factor antagonist)